MRHLWKAHMNHALIEHIVDSIPKDCSRDELIDHLFTILSRSEATKEALGQLYRARQTLHGVLERERNDAWHLRFDDIAAKISEVRARCSHIGVGQCTICRSPL